MRKRYLTYQRGEGRKKRYMKYQRGEGLRSLGLSPGIISLKLLRPVRRRRSQKGRGIFGIIGRVAKAVINNPTVRKIAKDVIPLAIGAIHKKMGGRKRA